MTFACAASLKCAWYALKAWTAGDEAGNDFKSSNEGSIKTVEIARGTRTTVASRATRRGCVVTRCPARAQVPFVVTFVSVSVPVRGCAGQKRALPHRAISAGHRLSPASNRQTTPTAIEGPVTRISQSCATPIMTVATTTVEALGMIDSPTG